MIYFVTGTDTGVGKTHVTAALVRALRARGRDARAVKPIETGWDEPTSDAAQLAAASGRTLDQTILLRFGVPRSPSAAARAEGCSIDPDEVAAWCRAAGGDPCLVEGAGGWMVPIRDRWRMRDLATALGASPVIVARAGLGTINHSVLTWDAAPGALGIILSCRPDDDPAFARENADEIAAQTGARVAIHPEQLGAIVDWF